jgi:hypothetical protein
MYRRHPPLPRRRAVGVGVQRSRPARPRRSEWTGVTTRATTGPSWSTEGSRKARESDGRGYGTVVNIGDDETPQTARQGPASTVAHAGVPSLPVP